MVFYASNHSRSNDRSNGKERIWWRIQASGLFSFRFDDGYVGYWSKGWQAENRQDNIIWSIKNRPADRFQPKSRFPKGRDMTPKPIVLVTGAAVRIGRAIATEFAKSGFRAVIHHHRSQIEARELVAELEARFPAGHLAVAADLRLPQEREALFNDLCERGLLPSVLVNNASTYRRGPLLELDEAGLAEDYAVNLVAPLMLMRLFARHCRSGCIINLLDQRVAGTEANTGGYGLAKKSLRDATELAALEWAPGIRVNGVAPGLVLPAPGVPFEKMERLLANVPLRAPIAAEAIGKACVFLANTHSITGQILFLDGGQHLTAPVAIETLRPHV